MKCNNKRCIREARDGFKSCVPCAASIRESARRAYQRKMAAGECMNSGCHELVVPDRRRCAEHLESSSLASLRSKGNVRQGVYRSKYNQGFDPDDAANAHLVKLGAEDVRLLSNGRCRCGLLLPCACLPVSAAGWRAYAGGPSE